MRRRRSAQTAGRTSVAAGSLRLTTIWAALRAVGLGIGLGLAAGAGLFDTAPAFAAPAPAADPSPQSAALADAPLAAAFQRQVTPQLQLPLAEREAYALRLQRELDSSPLSPSTPQFVLLVDRSAHVQAALLYFGPTGGRWAFVGAAPVSTGLPGRFEHFTTPLGVFDHNISNNDFRAEGTQNKLGFRGYGRKGLRVYDFGWIEAPRGWGNGAMGVLRLQMHATDPDLAEWRLGTPQSEGCVRIPAALNDFIDRHGLLDQDYLQAAAAGPGMPRWVLRKDRTPTATPGRTLVVVDSERPDRPAWSPLPVKR